MIDARIHEALYRQYPKPPESPDYLDLSLLFEGGGERHRATVDMNGPVEALEIGSIAAHSPFHRIPLSRIHAILAFEDWIAVVLRSSIIYLHKHSADVKVHIRDVRPSLMDKIKDLFGR